MRTASRHPRNEPVRRREAGFTLVEALVSLAIFSAVAVSVWTGAGIGLRAGVRIVREAKENAALLTLDGLVRAEAQRIVVPFWETPIEVGTSSATVYAERVTGAVGSDTGGSGRSGNGVALVLPWYDGVKDSMLRIETRGRSVAVTAAGLELIIPTESLEIEFSLGPDRGRLELETVGRHGTNRIVAPFGGVPLVKTESGGAEQ